MPSNPTITLFGVIMPTLIVSRSWGISNKKVDDEIMESGIGQLLTIENPKRGGMCIWEAEGEVEMFEDVPAYHLLLSGVCGDSCVTSLHNVCEERGHHMIPWAPPPSNSSAHSSPSGASTTARYREEGDTVKNLIADFFMNVF